MIDRWYLLCTNDSTRPKAKRIASERLRRVLVCYRSASEQAASPIPSSSATMKSELVVYLMSCEFQRSDFHPSWRSPPLAGESAILAFVGSARTIFLTSSWRDRPDHERGWEHHQSDRSAATCSISDSVSASSYLSSSGESSGQPSSCDAPPACIDALVLLSVFQASRRFLWTAGRRDSVPPR